MEVELPLMAKQLLDSAFYEKNLLVTYFFFQGYLGGAHEF